MKLTAIKVALPSPGTRDDLFARQLGPRHAQWSANPGEVGPNLTRLRFVDEAGVDRFEACLFRGEDGPVYRFGSTEMVACFSQSSASECDDDDLAQRLEESLRELRRASARRR